MWPPRTIANDSALLKYALPGSSDTVSLPALMRSASTSASGGYGPTPSIPFSECRVMLHAGRYEVRHERRHPDAQIHIVAVVQFAGHAPDDPLTLVHRLTPRQTLAQPLRVVRRSIRFW